MASSGNFCTLNPLPYSTSFRSNLGKGNLFSNPGNNCMGFGTMALTSGKKWYMEGIAQNAYNTTMGIFEINDANLIQSNLNTFYYNNTSYKSAFYHRDGTKYIDGSNSSYGATFAIGDVIGMAVDLESGTNTITFYKNNASQGSFNLGTNGLDYLFCMARGTSGGGWFMNFGQDSTFGGNKTAGGNADDSGFGDFFYAVPSGYLAVCSGNLGISSDIDPAGDDGATENPTKQFGIVTYTGSSTSAQTITGLGFKPDLVWAKMRNSSQRNFLTDTSRGISKHLFSDATSAEETDSSMGNTNPIYTAFNDDGFVFGTSGSGPNDSGREYVAWCWKANGGTTASNSNGSITSTVQANTKSGFSIITYTGTGSNATIGHGLSAKPDFFTIKNRDGGAGMAWATYHSALGATKYIELDANDGAYSGSTRFNDTEPTTSTIGIGTISHVNSSGSDYVCYAWHNVEGMQRFGSYTGTGNADGAFIYTGFRPRLLAVKKTSGSDNWVVIDSARETFNAMGEKILMWDTTDAEFDPSNVNLDFVSNGVKMRNTDGKINANGADYIYMAWADVPFKYNNTF